jgi:menaquinone-9 beta-reductase
MSNTSSTTDILIIGAGPGGCVAAISQARRGHNVALIEQHRFPRDKVCGECLSALGIDVLNRLHLKQPLASSRPTLLTRSELIAPAGETATIDLPRPMWGLTRRALDSALLDEARNAGVEILQPARYESGLIRDLITNTTRVMNPRITILADGKPACGLAPIDLGVKAHFTNVRGDSNTISLFGLNGHYVGLAPVENETWNLAMSVPAARVRELHGDLDALFDQMLTQNRELAHRMRHATRATAWLTCPLPRSAVSQTWLPNVIPIGNAAAALEPIGGEGLGLAMRSAELAADAIDAALRRNRAVDTTTLRREYQKLWKWRSRTARATALLMLRPRCAQILVRAMQSCDAIIRPALVPLGK